VAKSLKKLGFCFLRPQSIATDELECKVLCFNDLQLSATKTFFKSPIFMIAGLDRKSAKLGRSSSLCNEWFAGFFHLPGLDRIWQQSGSE
jgi:hypothetical protein